MVGYLGGMAWYVSILRPQGFHVCISEIPVNAAGEEDGLILSLAQDDKLGYIWLTTGHDFMALQIQPDRTLKQLKFPGRTFACQPHAGRGLERKGMFVGISF